MSSYMTWEEKLTAMQAIAPNETLLTILGPGDWLCQHPGKQAGDGLLSSVPRRGPSPEAAVNAQWETIANLPSGRYLEVTRPGELRRRYRWGGFMWIEVPAEGAAR